MKFPFGEARGKEEIYNPVIEALSEKPMTLRELCAQPLLRTGLPVPWLKQLLLKAVRQNLKADDYIWSILESIGHRLKVEGKTLSDPEENKAEIRSKLDEFIRVLRPQGFLIVTCPDLQSVCALVAEDKLTEAAYTAPA